MELWRRELALALRGLVRRPAPGLAIAAIVGVSVGAASALFSVVNALALRPVAGVDGAGLVNVYRTTQGAFDGFSGHSHPTFLELGERAETLAGLAAFSGRGLSLDVGGGPELTGVQFVSGRYFDVLGTRGALGRLLTVQDDQPGSEAIVLSYSLWERRLGGAPDAVGRLVRVNGRPFTVVGVAEPGFRGHFVGFPFDAFVPLQAAPRLASDIELASRASDDLELVGRLAQGVELPRAHADLSRVMTRLEREHPDSLRGVGVLVKPWTGLDADLQGWVLGFVGVLLALAALVLLVAFTNVAGLMTARALERRRETAVRLALGADRRALLRKLVAESLLPFASGGALGLLLAGAAADALHAFLPAFPLPIRLELGADWHVASFAASLTLISGIGFGVLPGVGVSRFDVTAGLRLASRGTTARHPLRRLFVSAQVTLTVALLVVTGLFGRALHQARRLETGFSVARVAVASADVRTVDLPVLEGRRFFEAWRERVAAQPGVEAAALVRSLPLGFGGLSGRLTVPGLEAPTLEGFGAGWNAVSPGYFDALGIALLYGRDFGAQDGVDAERVTIVSRSTAARLFSGREPIGAQLRWEDETLRVVGVVADTANRQPGALGELFFYVPLAQNHAPRLSLVARGRTAPPLAALGDSARALEPELPLLAVQTLAQHTTSALFPQRIAASLAGAFGALGLLLAVAGLYALVATQVAERRRELAVRAALGATRAALRRLVLADALWTVCAGLVAGCLAALAVGRLASSFLPGVGAFDLSAFAIAGLTMLAAGALGAGVAARRAAGSQATDVLRAE